jgi:hypothetical protein
MSLTLEDTDVQDLSVDLAVDRLTEELGERSHVVRPVVQECRQELSGVPVAALPELVERLARYRLLLPGD